jgi:catechol 2,3-dioxygenase-like lactoylglutathione lyase family enzyme
MNQDLRYLRDNFNGLQHIGIPVTNLIVSIDFYTKLGFNQILATHVEVPEKKDQIQVAMMKQEEVIIELYQLPNIDLKLIRKRNDGHLDHIAFNVKDINKSFQELKQGNFEIIETGPIFLNFWENGCKYFTIRGPDGEKLEFNQIM